MDNFTKKHLQDILNAIQDIETFFEGQPKLFEEFCKDIRLQRAIERCIEIIGEAMNRILKEHPDIPITNARKSWMPVIISYMGMIVFPLIFYGVSSLIIFRN